MVELIVTKENNFKVGTVLKVYVKKYDDRDRMEVTYSNGYLIHGFLTEKLKRLKIFQHLRSK